MGRLAESSWGTNQLGSYSAENWSASGATVSTMHARTGAYCLRSYSTGGGSFSILSGWTGQVGGLVFASIWFYVAALPTSGKKLMFLGKAGGSGTKWDMSAYIGSDGRIMLNVAGNSRGTTTNAAVVGSSYCLQMSMKIDGANSVHVIKVFGETLSYDGNEPDTQAVSYLYVGKDAGDPTYDIYFSDFVLNDDQGSDENSYPDPQEHVGYLMPIGENAIGGWTGGGGGVTNLFDAVNNAPPAGNSSETDQTNVKNAVASATDNIDFVCQPYSILGIGSGYNIHVVRAIVRHGEHTATNTKAGAVLIALNPLQPSEDGFTFGGDAGAHGTEIGNWRTTFGAPQYSPTVAYETNPIVRVGKRTATTDVVCCDFVALIVSYAPVPLQSADFIGSGGGVGAGQMDSNVGVTARGSGGGIGGGTSRFYARSFQRQAKWFSNRLDGTLTIGTARSVLRYPTDKLVNAFRDAVTTDGWEGIGVPTLLEINISALHDVVTPAVLYELIALQESHSQDGEGKIQVQLLTEHGATPLHTYLVNLERDRSRLRAPRVGRLKSMVIRLEIPADQLLNVEDLIVKEILLPHVKRPRIGMKFA
jgi:hypothetical protein